MTTCITPNCNAPATPARRRCARCRRALHRVRETPPRDLWAAEMQAARQGREALRALDGLVREQRNA